VQLAYLDESKTARAYYITALVVADTDCVGLGRALDEVVEWASDTYGRVSERAELHAVDLAGGRGDWARWRAPIYIPARVAVYERAVAAIAGFDVRAYIRGADIDTHHQRYAVGTDIHGTVLPWVLERVQNDAAYRDDLVLAIADEHQLRERYRGAMREFQRSGTSGWKPEVLDRIADTLHFAPSHSSRLLQAADLVSYAHTQTKRRHVDSRAEAAYARIWGVLAPVIKEASCWYGP